MMDEHPDLYKSVLYYANESGHGRINLSGKLIFLAIYKGDNNLLKCSHCNKTVKYDAYKKVFRSMCNTCSLARKDIKSTIEQANILPKQTVIDLLNSNQFHYTKYFGKSKNRTMIKECPDLYKSVLYYSNKSEHIIKNLSGKLIYLAIYHGNNDLLRCKYCNKMVKYSPNDRAFRSICNTCYLTKESTKTYSIVSQELFDILNRNGCMYKTKNKEFFIASPNKTYAYDFRYKNKLIEFNGDM